MPHLDSFFLMCHGWEHCFKCLQVFLAGSGFVQGFMEWFYLLFSLKIRSIFFWSSIFLIYTDICICDYLSLCEVDNIHLSEKIFYKMYVFETELVLLLVMKKTKHGYIYNTCFRIMCVKYFFTKMCHSVQNIVIIINLVLIKFHFILSQILIINVHQV